MKVAKKANRAAKHGMQKEIVKNSSLYNIFYTIEYRNNSQNPEMLFFRANIGGVS